MNVTNNKGILLLIMIGLFACCTQDIHAADDLTGGVEGMVDDFTAQADTSGTKSGSMLDEIATWGIWTLLFLFLIVPGLVAGVAIPRAFYLINHQQVKAGVILFVSLGVMAICYFGFFAIFYGG